MVGKYTGARQEQYFCTGDKLQYIPGVENAEIIVLNSIFKDSIEHIYKNGVVVTHENIDIVDNVHSALWFGIHVEYCVIIL